MANRLAVDLERVIAGWLEALGRGRFESDCGSTFCFTIEDLELPD